MKRILKATAIFMLILSLCSCGRQDAVQAKDTLLNEIGINSTQNIDYIIFEYIENYEGVKIEDSKEFDFLNAVYSYDLPTERFHELFLFPDTAHVKIGSDNGENEKSVCLLSDGSIVFETGEDNVRKYKVYITEEGHTPMTRESRDKLILKYAKVN